MTGKETKTCFRSYTAWQYQEEVDWMNKMAAEGWALERTNGFVHHFSRCEPGAWIIRRTSSSRLPQKEQRRDFFVSSLMD